ncbi:MAG: MjaI family restriction endonuclease [Calditrichaeota bacterium]|nr:MjaI family restriction endonuclease [Calditrichota bacterium]
MKTLITFAELRDLLAAPPPDLPTYVAPLLNLANRYAGATRPRVVGQMSTLIQEFEGHTFEERASWYQARFPNAIEDACRLIREKLFQFKGVLEGITDEMIRKWVEDLILAKTFVGLKYQEAILKKVAEVTGLAYRLATPAEEARGVDGVVGETEVSIKPSSWPTQVLQREDLGGVLITYEKKGDGVEIEFDPGQFRCQ